MDFLKKNYMGIMVCFIIALPSWLMGKRFPVVGGAVIAIILGMIIALFWNDKGKAADGIKFTSKMILQAAVVLLGFGMNLSVVLQTGKQSLPIIICTISTSLIVAWIFHKVTDIKMVTTDNAIKWIKFNGITYDDQSSVSEAIRTLIRAANIERRS